MKVFACANDVTVRRLAEEVLRLRAAIAAHAGKRGHELCWLNDLELWKAIGLDVGYPHEHGGCDNGKPAIRADYAPDYYAAFLIDPDGYRIEAYCRGKQKR